MTPTPTPRTDAEWQSVTVSAPWDAAAEHMAQVARELERELEFSEKTGRQIWEANEQLERELAEARKQIADWQMLLELEVGTMRKELAAKDAHADEIYKAGVDLAAMLEDKLAAERALADRLAETLANVQGDYASTGGITTPEVDEALAAWKEARGGTD